MDAPGKVEDLTPGTRMAWDEALSTWFRSQVEVAKSGWPKPPQNKAWFFDPVSDGLDGAVPKDIRWTAYPKRFPGNFMAVDGNRDFQEEYCEWEVARGSDGKVLRVTFTTETEDYFHFLAAVDSAKLLDLYRRHVSPQVLLDDLIRAGRYEPRNRWNWPVAARGGLMHMAQGNNTLGAAMNLAANATWPIVDASGVAVTAEQALIQCHPFGVAGRHSDPHIGGQVNELVRSGLEVSFADPVGLYVDEWNLALFETPDGSPPSDLVRVTRGVDGFATRVVFEAPAGATWSLGDVKVDGSRIGFGGQIAQHLTIRLRGAARPTSTKAPSTRCRTGEVVGGEPQLAAAVTASAAARRNLSRNTVIQGFLAPE